MNTEADRAAETTPEPQPSPAQSERDPPDQPANLPLEPARATGTDGNVVPFPVRGFERQNEPVATGSNTAATTDLFGLSSLKQNSFGGL